MTRVAFTGFRPFPGVPDNPTQTLMRALSTSPLPALANCVLRVIDTSYASVPVSLGEVLAEAPRALVMTGYSNRATGVTLETIATDHCLPGRPDAAGFCPPEVGAETLQRLKCARVDFAALLARLHGAGIAAELSEDAGGYVCNHAYFSALSQIAAGGSATPALFVHVPAISGTALAETSAAAMPLAQLVEALAIIADTLVPG